MSLARRAMEHGQYTCYTQRSPVYRVRMHGVSNRDIHLYPPHNNSSFYRTTTYVRRSGRIFRWNAEWLNNTTRLRTYIPDTGTHSSGIAFQEQRAAYRLTASAPVSDVSAPACTNVVWPPLWPVSVAQKNKPSTMFSANAQSIEPPWTARPDCSR